MSDSQLSEQSSLVGILNRVQAWTVAADQKISVVTAVQTLACGFLFPEVRDWISRPSTSTLLRVALLIGCGCLVASIACSLRALFPVTKVGSAKSATFFGTIESWSLADYEKHIAAMDSAAWNADYLSQIHVNSRIATRKYELAKTSILLFVIGSVIVGFCYFGALAGL